MTQEPPSADQSTPERPAEHAPAAVRSLRRAMRRARFDDAERVGVIADLRAARIGRLELLQDALAPLVAQIPRDVDLFDVGLMPGANPRLFIDMIGFVEMGRDSRLYRFFQDTRHGRVQLAESENMDTMVDAITDYVARRLLERDKALAADADGVLQPRRPSATKTARQDRRDEAAADRRQLSRPMKLAGMAFAFLIDLLGSITFFSILAALGWMIWSHMHGAP